MAKQLIDKQAREYILTEMMERGVMTREEIKDLVRPYYVPDYSVLVDQKLNQIVNNLVRALRDETGARVCFGLKSTGEYVNVDVCNDVNRLRKVDEYLLSLIAGLEISQKKTHARRAELEGQLSMEEIG